MGRMDKGIDDKLIKTGLKMAQANGGLNSFSIRELCAKAGANLGLFSYYFKTRQNFNREMLKYAYSHLIKEIEVNAAGESPRENIKQILLAMNSFAKRNRKIVSALAGDVLRGDKETIDFLMGNFTQHIKALMEQLGKTELSENAAKQHILSVMMSMAMPVVMPQLICGLLERTGKRRMLSTMEKTAQSIESIEGRIEMLIDAALKGN